MPVTALARTYGLSGKLTKSEYHALIAPSGVLTLLAEKSRTLFIIGSACHYDPEMPCSLAALVLDSPLVKHFIVHALVIVFTNYMHDLMSAVPLHASAGKK